MRALWIDDQINRYAPWVNTFPKYGLSVETAYSMSEGYEKLEGQEFDYVFVDAMLGHESCLPHLPHLARKIGGAELMICSGFFYLDNIIDQTNRLLNEMPVGLIDKTSLPFVGEELSMREFVNSLSRRGENVPSLRSPRDKVDIRPVGRGLPSWAEYCDMTIAQRLAAADAVAAETADLRHRLFNDGYQYVLFCGSVVEPVVKRDLSGALEEQEVIEIARAYDSAPFPFSYSRSIDDLSQKCPASGLDGYPYLKISYSGTSEEVHYDTGNSLSLMSYEWYLEQGWFVPMYVVEVHQAGDLTFKGKRLKLEGVTFGDSQGGTIVGHFVAFAVTNWRDYRLAAKCAPGCSGKSDKRLAGLCRFRTGLLGRDLPRSMQCDFKIDSYSGEVVFIRRGA